MSPIRKTSLRARFSALTLLAIASGLPSCSSGAGADEDGNAGDNADETGTVGLAVKLGNVTLNSIAYSITKDTYSKTGSIDVSNSDTVSALIGGIPAGTGYSITLSGSDAANSGVTCSSTATFSVSGGSTTAVSMTLQCRLPDENGSVQVNGTVNVCPRIDGLSVSPTEVSVGHSIAIVAQVTDSDARPNPVSFAYTANGGTLTGATTPSAAFNCTATGTYTVTLTVTDGACTDTETASVTCSPGSVTPPPTAVIKVNEVESNGGTPGDWTELYNPGTTSADISGWVFKDNDDTHVYTFPAGTAVPAGGYYVVEEAAQVFGLGSADSVRLYDKTGTLVDSYTWTAHAATTYGRCPNGTGALVTMPTVTKGAKNDCSVPVKINEVESNGGTPGDWTELINNGTSAVDLSGYVFKDNDDTHGYVIPAGTTIAAGGYYVIEEAAQGFGLGSADSVRLYDPTGTTLVDSYDWTAHATTTYARCPNGTGAFATAVASTKGLTNSCAPTGPVTVAWPGGADVVTADAPAQFTSNLSGLTYEPATASTPAVLWAVVNGPGTLFRLVKSGSIWTPDVGDWSAGKALRYTNGTGNPDSEGTTYGSSVADGMYVATERNNDASTVSRLSVLRYDVSVPGTSLTASHDWDLTSLLPATGANLGLEAITWLPDTYLVANGFFDEAAGHAYAPTDYPGHGTGLFAVGVEGTGNIHVFALNHSSGAAIKLATFASGNTGAMGMEFDRDVGYLWSTCDDTCGNKASILTIDTTNGSPTKGRFVLRRQFTRPTGLPDTNNEGFALAPESECVAGVKPVFWSDDNDLGGNSLRIGTVNCGAFLSL